MKGNSTTPWIQGVLKTIHCQNSLKEYPSEDLVGLAKYILEKNKGKTINNHYLMWAGAGEDLFVGSGAFNVLEEKHGREKALNMIGYRNPKTLREKLNYFFTKELPKYEEVA